MKPAEKYILCTVSLLSLLLFPRKMSSSCSWWPDGEEFRISMFLPLTPSVQHYRSFIFTTDYLYDYSSWEADNRVYMQNSVEWKHELGRKVKEDHIYTILYETDPKAFAKALDRRIRRQPDSLRLDTNTFIKALLKPAKKELLNYLVFSKRCEQLILHPDPWQEHYPDTNAMRQLILEGIKRRQEAKTPFLQARYGFQLVKLSRNIDRMEDCIRYHHDWVAPVAGSSVVKYWSMAHVASALKALGKIGEANYMYSKVFDGTDDRKIASYEGFDVDQLEAALALAKNTHERVTMLALKELKNPGRSLSGIQEIYRLSPEEEVLDILLLREVNKLEDWIFTEPLTGFTPAIAELSGIAGTPEEINYRKDLTYVRKLRAFTGEALKSGKVKSRDLWTLTSAYLALLGEENALAAGSLAASGKLIAADSKLAVQLHLCRIMLLVRESAGITRQLENELARELFWLEKNTSAEYSGDLKEQVLLFLSERYQKEGNIARAALCRFRNGVLYKSNRGYGYAGDYFDFLDRYASVADVDSFLIVLSGRRSSLFEKFLLERTVQGRDEWMEYREEEAADMRTNRLLDLKGTLLLREDRPEEALKVFSAIPGDFWKREVYGMYLSANPFYADYIDSHRASVHDTVAYTKPEMIRKLLEYRDGAEAGGKEAAKSAWHLANAYYNMTYYGNSWLMINYHWSLHDGPEESPLDYERDYYGCRKAKELYLRAMNLAGPELAAKCCLMAARCEKNLQRFSDRKQEANVFLALFQKKYRKTAFHRELVSKCAGEEFYVKFIASPDYQ
jgi:hypothetical protein